MDKRPLRIRRFEAGTGESRRWYFDVVAGNGEIVAESEGYNSAEARDETVELLRGGEYTVEDR